MRITSKRSADAVMRNEVSCDFTGRALRPCVSIDPRSDVVDTKRLFLMASKFAFADRDDPTEPDWIASDAASAVFTRTVFLFLFACKLIRTSHKNAKS